MPNTIKIKRGQSANISSVTLEEGELAVTLDTGELYVGDGTDKIQLNGGGNVVSEILNLIYPTGSILINTTGANPSDYLGIGTWEAWGSGRVPVGVDSGTFATAEETGGAETVALTTNELPSHSHTISAHTHTISSHTHSLPSHTHSWSGTTSSSGSHSHGPANTDMTGFSAYVSGSAARHQLASGSSYYAVAASSISGVGYSTGTDSSGAHTHTVSGTTGSTSGTSGSTSLTTASGGGTTSSSTGSGESFSILQPYITCYMWKRIN